MKDACDRQSFGAADVDCLRNGGILFDKFIGQLGKHAIMRAWHFAPSVVHAKVGQTLMAVNRGGEEHTFTEVEEYRGRDRSGAQRVDGKHGSGAGVSTTLADDDFIQPGGFDADDEVEEPGTELYQCCIHPSDAGNRDRQLRHGSQTSPRGASQMSDGCAAPGD